MSDGTDQAVDSATDALRGIVDSGVGAAAIASVTGPAAPIVEHIIDSVIDTVDSVEGKQLVSDVTETVAGAAHEIGESSMDVAIDLATAVTQEFSVIAAEIKENVDDVKKDGFSIHNVEHAIADGVHDIVENTKNLFIKVETEVHEEVVSSFTDVIKIFKDNGEVLTKDVHDAIIVLGKALISAEAKKVGAVSGGFLKGFFLKVFRIFVK